MSIMSKSAFSRECPYLYRGVVEDNQDPLHLGRCKIRVPSVHGELTYPVHILPWARPLVLSPVRKSRGSVNLPDKGDIVWVLFEGGMRDFPIYLGGSYAKDEIEVDTNIVSFYIEDDTKISYNRADKLYTIQIGDNAIKLSKDSITIVGDVEIQGNLTVNDIHINGSCNKECDCL